MTRAYTPFAPGTAGSFAPLRRICGLAAVPLVDADGWALPDPQVTAAVRAARRGGLTRGVAALEAAIRSGKVPVSSRVYGGAMTGSEVVALAQILRSSVADTADVPGV